MRTEVRSGSAEGGGDMLCTLPEKLANKCAYPPGCDVLSLFAERTTVKLGRVQRAGINLNSARRPTCYGLTTGNDNATTTVVKEQDLVFAPRIPVWLTLPHGREEVKAVVVASEYDPTDFKTLRYSVQAMQEGQKIMHSEVRASNLRFRFSSSATPAATKAAKIPVGSPSSNSIGAAPTLSSDSADDTQPSASIAATTADSLPTPTVLEQETESSFEEPVPEEQYESSGSMLVEPASAEGTKPKSEAVQHTSHSTPLKKEGLDNNAMELNNNNKTGTFLNNNNNNNNKKELLDKSHASNKAQLNLPLYYTTHKGSHRNNLANNPFRWINPGPQHRIPEALHSLKQQGKGDFRFAAGICFWFHVKGYCTKGASCHGAASHTKPLSPNQAKELEERFLLVMGPDGPIYARNAAVGERIGRKVRDATTKDNSTAYNHHNTTTAESSKTSGQHYDGRPRERCPHPEAVVSVCTPLGATTIKNMTPNPFRYIQRVHYHNIKKANKLLWDDERWKEMRGRFCFSFHFRGFCPYSDCVGRDSHRALTNEEAEELEAAFSPALSPKGPIYAAVVNSERRSRADDALQNNSKKRHHESSQAVCVQENKKRHYESGTTWEHHAYDGCTHGYNGRDSYSHDYLYRCGNSNKWQCHSNC